MRRSYVAGFLLAAALLAVPDTAHAQNKKRGNRFLITQDELAEAAATSTTAADLIRTMRPYWLNPPLGRNASSNMSGIGGGGGGGGGATEVQLYVDDIRQPNLDVLSTIKATELVELRYLEQNRAVQMKGPGHELGVIDITTINKKK